MSISTERLNLQVPDELMFVMQYYEIRCVMGCCGMDALDLTPQYAVNGIRIHGLAWADLGLSALDALIKTVLQHPGEVLSDQNGLGHYWKTGADAALDLNKVRDSLSAAIENVKRNGLSEIR